MADWAIEADGLTRAFGPVLAVEDVSFRIPRGHVFSLLAPTAGEARVAGHDVRTEALGVRARVGLLTEVPGLYESLSAWRNLEFYAELHGLDGSRRDARIRAVLERLGIWERREARVATFSKGMKQKIAIAPALLHEPQGLFLHQPT